MADWSFEGCVVYGVAQIAQLVEHVLGKDEVTGSIPVLGLDMKLEKLSFFSEASASHGEGEI